MLDVWQAQAALFDAFLACTELVALAQADAENRYLRRKARGKPTVGLRLLDKLDGKGR